MKNDLVEMAIVILGEATGWSEGKVRIEFEVALDRVVAVDSFDDARQLAANVLLRRMGSLIQSHHEIEQAYDTLFEEKP